MSSETEAVVDAAPAKQPGSEQQKSYPADLPVPLTFAINETPTLIRMAEVASRAANLELGGASAVFIERVRLAQAAAAKAYDDACDAKKSSAPKKGK